jgi:hypothetical protein
MARNRLIFAGEKIVVVRCWLTGPKDLTTQAAE